MQWISRYQLFLFDFDGLLVDTERLHYQAYIDMCAKRGFKLNWSFSRYSAAAHHHSTGLQDQIYAEFPSLYASEPDWNVLYEEKKRLFLNLVESRPAPLLPGAASLLVALQKAAIKRCVVTHSPASLIQKIRKQNPILDTIPHWITRHDYTRPKPDPECYRYAISTYGAPTDAIIGFEDSPRGLHALLETKAQAVLICPPDSSYLPELLENQAVTYFSNFDAITEENAPIPGSRP